MKRPTKEVKHTEVLKFIKRSLSAKQYASLTVKEKQLLIEIFIRREKKC